MKKLIIGVLIVIAVFFGFALVRQQMSSAVSPVGGDLIIVNDSTDAVSSEYTSDGQVVAQVLQPGEQTTGGKGLIRIFTAKKSGVYEIQYPYPRLAGKPGTIALSTILQAVKSERTGDNLYTKTGMIEDVLVSYEEVQE